MLRAELAAETNARKEQALRAEMEKKEERLTNQMEKNKMKAAMGLKDLKAELEKAAMLQQIRELQRDLAQIRSQRSSSSIPMLPASRPDSQDIGHSQPAQDQQTAPTPVQAAAPPPQRSAGATAAIDMRAQAAAARAVPTTEQSAPVPEAAAPASAPVSAQPQPQPESKPALQPPPQRAHQSQAATSPNAAVAVPLPTGFSSHFFIRCERWPTPRCGLERVTLCACPLSRIARCLSTAIRRPRAATR